MGWGLRLACYIGLVLMAFIWWWGLMDIIREVWEVLR